MNLWIELTGYADGVKLLFNINNIDVIGESNKGFTSVSTIADPQVWGIKESYAEVKQKIEDAMNTYTRLFGNQYVNFPPIKTTTDDLAINKL